MGKWTIIVRDGKSQTRTTVVEANGVDQIRERCAQRGMTLVSATPAEPHISPPPPPPPTATNGHDYNLAEESAAPPAPIAPLEHPKMLATPPAFEEPTGAVQATGHRQPPPGYFGLLLVGTLAGLAAFLAYIAVLAWLALSIMTYYGKGVGEWAKPVEQWTHRPLPYNLAIAGAGFLSAIIIHALASACGALRHLARNSFK